MGRGVELRVRAVVALAAASLAGLLPACASATFPGRNGLLALPVDHNVYVEGVMRVPPSGSRIYALGPRASFFYGCDFEATSTGYCPDGSQPPNNVERASFSSDGKTLVTSTGGRIVFVAGDDSRSTRSLPQLTAYDAAPVFLKGGKLIAFAGKDARSGTTGIYVAGADGTGVRMLAKEGSDPAASPDGRWIAFERSGDLWLMHADGSGAHRLVRHATAACFSPDGKHLVFFGASRVPGVTARVSNSRGIERIDVNGSHLRVLTRQSGYPVWSPDGKQIAYAQNTRDYNSRLWVMPASGGKRRLLAYDSPVSEDATTYVGFLAPDWQPRPR